MATNVITSKRTRVLERHENGVVYEHNHPGIQDGFIAATGPYDWSVYPTLDEARQALKEGL